LSSPFEVISKRWLFFDY